MKRSTLLAVALAAHIGASQARAAKEPPPMTNGEKLGALITLCPGFIEASMSLLVGNDKRVDFARWESKNEFDGPWRAQIEKQEVDGVRGRFGRYFSADNHYRIDTWLYLGPYDFKASQFPLLHDVLVRMPPPPKGKVWAEAPRTTKARIGHELYLSLFKNQQDIGMLTGGIGLLTAPPKALVIQLPVGITGHATGMVPCAGGGGVCLQVSESEAKSIADPTLNPDRLIHITMRVIFDACTRKMGASFTDDDYVLHVQLAYLAVQAAHLHRPSGLLSKFYVPIDPPKEIFDIYSMGDDIWEWHAPSSNDANPDSASSAQ
ncbi:MAG: hypothetical protein ACYC9P_05310 [Rudaea sp.]